MSCILSSQGVVLATTMVVFGTLVLLSLFRDKNFPPTTTHELLVSENQDSRSSIPILTSCLSSGGKRGEGKKKKVKFADDVKGGSNGRKTSRGGELRKKRKVGVVAAASCGNQFQRMPPNRVALYGGILRDLRLHRMECT